MLYIVAWVMPELLGPERVKQLMFAMLIEFLVLHSSAMFESGRPPGWSPEKYLSLLVGLGTIYVTFAALFAWAWDSPWPFYAFLWFFFCRYFRLLTYPSLPEDPDRTTFYVANLGTFFVAMFVLPLPLPRLGLTPEFTTAMQIAGSGTLVQEPRLLITFGVTYFLLQAWLKYKLAPTRERVACA